MGLTDKIRSAPRVVIEVLLGLAVLIALSLAVGPCSWSGKPPKPVPGTVDPGRPVPGPAAEAPTVQTCLPVAVPDLTREEVLEAARRYGLKIQPEAAGGRRSPDRQDAAQPQPQSSIASEAPSVAPAPAEFPVLVAEEEFRHTASGATIRVAGFLTGLGERIDLRGEWQPWSPPAAPASPSSWLPENAARWRFAIGPGLAVTEEGAAPGLYLGAGYRGWKWRKATLGFEGASLLAQDVDRLTAIAALTIGFE